MSSTPCRYARRCPELWERLPDDRARRSLSDALASFAAARASTKPAGVQFRAQPAHLPRSEHA
jgi:hypothetical protein